MQIQEFTKDKYKTIWVSYSSISDFLKCPKLYYLHNVYKNTRGRKISIISPSMSLGTAVHSTLENLANFKAEERMRRDLMKDFENNWQKVSGEIGGFKNKEEEKIFKERGGKMIQRVIANPNFLLKKTIKFPNLKNQTQKIDKLPHYYLNETENIILCGKIDWIEYIEEIDGLRIIDFKTGKNEEGDGSLQLPIYQLLLHNLQKRKVVGAQYWYLEYNDKPIDIDLININEAYEKIYTIAKKIKSARQENNFKCQSGKEECIYCMPYIKILNDEAKYVGKGEYGQDLYMI